MVKRGVRVQLLSDPPTRSSVRRALTTATSFFYMVVQAQIVKRSNVKVTWKMIFPNRLLQEGEKRCGTRILQLRKANRLYLNLTFSDNVNKINYQFGIDYVTTEF